MNAAIQSPEEKCLFCGKSKAKLTRGLCQTHYSRFLRALKKVPEQSKEDYEGKLVDKGLLLPVRSPGRKATDLDLFVELADVFTRNKKGDKLDQEADALIQQEIKRIGKKPGMTEKKDSGGNRRTK